MFFLYVMHFFQAEEESLQIDSSSELVGEGNPFAFIDPNLIEDEHGLEEIVIVDDTEETCSHLSFDVKEMDNEIPNDTTENFECVSIHLEKSFSIHMNIRCLF